VAYIDFGEWFNTLSNKFETVEGVWCNCYDCRFICENAGGRAFAHGHIFHSKNEYRRHKNERRLAYEARENEKIIRKEELKAALTKETEASAGHGRPAGVTTFFDLDSGNMVPDPKIIGSVRWETNWRASIQED
jgi:hypothetical protein